MAIVSTIDHTAYSPHLLLVSAVLAVKLPMKNASVSIMLIMNNIFIRLIRGSIRIILFAILHALLFILDSVVQRCLDLTQMLEGLSRCSRTAPDE